MVEALTNDTKAYNTFDMFTQTSYLPDMVAVIAMALDHVLKDKGREQNMSLLNITFGANDRERLADELLHLEAIDGITGPVSFSENGEREVHICDIRNFSPTENLNFTTDTSNYENPWVLFTAAILMQSRNSASFIFYEKNGSLSNKSTIIFADSTTTPPHDKPVRLLRSKHK